MPTVAEYYKTLNEPVPAGVDPNAAPGATGALAGGAGYFVGPQGQLLANDPTDTGVYQQQQWDRFQSEGYPGPWQPDQTQQQPAASSAAIAAPASSAGGSASLPSYAELTLSHTAPPAHIAGIPQTPASSAGSAAAEMARRRETRFVGAGAIAVGAAGGPVGLAIGIAVTISSILGSLFGGLFGGGPDLRPAINALRASIVDVGNELVASITAVARALGKVLEFLKALLIDVLHGIVGLLRKLVSLLGDLYNKVLKPALATIEKIRRKILETYERIIRPALLVIQKIRQVLAILKLFHIQFAVKLDAALAGLEAKLTAPMYFLLRYLNTVANYINLIMTAHYLLQRTLFINSAYAYQGRWVRQWWNAQTPPRGTPAPDPAAIAPLVPSTAAIESNFEVYARSGSGPLAMSVDAGVQRLRELSQR